MRREDDGGVLVDWELDPGLEVAQPKRQRVGHHRVRGLRELTSRQRFAVHGMVLVRFSRSVSTPVALGRNQSLVLHHRFDGFSRLLPAPCAPLASAPPNRGDETGEVLSARSTRLKMRGDAWEPAFGVLASDKQLAVHVQHVQRGPASDIARIGRQEALKLNPAVTHRDSPESESM